MTTVPPMQLRLNRREIINNITVLFSGSAIAQGMTVLTLLVTARQLGATQYGQYVSCFIFTSLSSIVISLGLDIWLLREGGRKPSRINKLVGSVLIFKGTAGIAWMGLMFVLAPLLDSNTFPEELIRLSALSVFLDSLFRTSLTTFKASLRNKVTSILESTSGIFWFLVTLLLITTDEQNASVYIQAKVGVLAMSLVLSLALVWRSFGILPTVITIKQAISQALPYATSEFLAWISMRVDVLIVAIFLGETAAGVYSPAVGSVNALFLVPATVYMVFVPVLSNLFTTNIKQAWLSAKRSILLLSVIGIGLSLGLLLLAGPLTRLLGPSFIGSFQIIQILSPILFLHSITFAMAAILVATDQQSKRAVVQTIAVVLNIILNLFIVRWAGLRGVAIVYVFTEIVLLAGYSSIVIWYRLQPVSTETSRTDQSDFPE